MFSKSIANDELKIINDERGRILALTHFLSRILNCELLIVHCESSIIKSYSG